MKCRRGLAMKILSVCLSVKCVDRDKTEEKSVQIFIPYERSFSLVFFRKNDWGEISCQTDALEQIADFRSIFARIFIAPQW